ncbi:hypothetical protein D9757_014804 [Collybiopsis confluens]|uniref:Ubiquitin-like protease family profile domain-containing protein n=1 Tax=Collybiopsis confluens TaxID=2823264 RepID=A0A8H5FNY8_9AGAR|nr:hypothetical protein D9757_014804 [Collybiopsis confluens]
MHPDTSLTTTSLIPEAATATALPCPIAVSAPKTPTRSRRPAFTPSTEVPTAPPSPIAPAPPGNRLRRHDTFINFTPLHRRHGLLRRDTDIAKRYLAILLGCTLPLKKTGRSTSHTCLRNGRLARVFDRASADTLSWEEFEIADHPEEHFIVHHRDPVEAIKALWGDPSLANHLVYKPAKLFYGDEQKEENRMFSEMWTGSFWNAVQNAIPEGGTVCPVIIASDKTQLTRFAGNKAAYPVYLTIGNVPKALRRKQGTRACVLIAYLSVDKPSAQKNLSKKALKLRNYEIFHRSMAAVLEPLKAAGKNGVEMVGGDGAVRMVYPILSTYVADYPEQCLVTCTKSGCCPKCKREAEELELPDTGDARKQKWTYEIIQEACEAAKKKKRGGNYVHKYAMDNYDVAAGTYEPFWVGFPLTDIHKCIAPDILHQCYQGVFKHLISWVKKLVGMDEIDQRLKALPPACGVRHFKKGISKLNQVTATEHKHIARVFLASLVGKLPSDGVEACRSLLHFIHLAQNPSHDQKTLGYMTEELEIWHKKKSFFIRTGVREEFNIPKFHSLSHYVESIKWLGTTDNYNTEMFERYHIDFAKEAWEASNKRDYFPQMIKWLSRQEKICAYDFYKSWVDSTEDKQAGLHEVVSSTSDDYDEENVVKHNVPLLVANLQNPRLITSNEIQLTKYPHEPRKSIHHIIVSHKATENQRAQTAAQLLEADLPFTSLDVWHHYKFTPINLFDDSSDVPKETIKSTPLSRKTSVTRFDTVIVLDSDEAESTAVIGCRIARVKVIFKLPQNVQRLSGGMVETASFNWPDVPLAYVTWYTRFKQAPDSKSGVGMYHVKPSYDSKGMAQGAIIPLSAIRQSCMLVPSKHAEWDPSWTSDNILDRCSSFLKRLGAFLKVIGLSTLSWISDMVMKQCAATEDVTPAYIKHDILPDLDLIGHTANYGAEFVPACEWMPICFELLDHAAVNSFGHIAKSLGAQDVLRALCSTIAIIIVAETGGPFTRIPAILNNKCPNRDSSVSASSIAGPPIKAMNNQVIPLHIPGLLDSRLQDEREVLTREISATIDQIQSIVDSEFPNVAATSGNRFYLDSKLHIKHLGDAARILSVVGAIHVKLNSHLKIHDALPSDNVALIALGNLKELYKCIIKKKLAIENLLWTAFDDHPEQTEARLTALMAQYSNFRTLGVGRWLDDEVVNYFVEKWCSRTGTTLGLNSFFAIRHLFKPGTCIPKDGYLTDDDQARVKAWCSKAAERLSLKNWDSVFIPINEDRLHWYSAHIDFRRKQINIYDSLKDRYIENHQKPPLLRKNASLMLVLLWLTETLSSIRGEQIELQDKLGSGWVCDPHFEVHFQPNSYDCGVHMLWHLQHVLELRRIMLGRKCHPSHLKFTDDMVGKRLRLAQEMLEDAGLSISNIGSEIKLCGQWDTQGDPNQNPIQTRESAFRNIKLTASLLELYSWTRHFVAAGVDRNGYQRAHWIWKTLYKRKAFVNEILGFQDFNTTKCSTAKFAHGVSPIVEGLDDDFWICRSHSIVLPFEPSQAWIWSIKPKAKTIGKADYTDAEVWKIRTLRCRMSMYIDMCGSEMEKEYQSLGTGSTRKGLHEFMVSTLQQTLAGEHVIVQIRLNQDKLYDTLMPLNAALTSVPDRLFFFSSGPSPPPPLARFVPLRLDTHLSNNTSVVMLLMKRMLVLPVTTTMVPRTSSWTQLKDHQTLPSPSTASTTSCSVRPIASRHSPLQQHVGGYAVDEADAGPSSHHHHGPSDELMDAAKRSSNSSLTKITGAWHQIQLAKTKICTLPFFFLRTVVILRKGSFASTCTGGNGPMRYYVFDLVPTLLMSLSPPWYAMNHTNETPGRQEFDRFSAQSG